MSEGNGGTPPFVGVKRGERRQAPVYRPTVEEFKDVLGYIASIRPEAEKFGLARIIPPKASWGVEFALDLAELEFKTRVQRIDKLHRRSEGKQDFWWDGYKTFWSREGKSRKGPKNPTLGGKVVDLFQLYTAVEQHGGYQKCGETKKWGEVAELVQVHLNNGNTTYSLRKVYEKYLKRFSEEHRDGFPRPPPFLAGQRSRAEQGHIPKAGDWLCDVAKAVKNREEYEAKKGSSKNSSRRTSMSGYDEDVLDLLADMKREKDSSQSAEGDGEILDRAKRLKTDEGPSCSVFAEQTQRQEPTGIPLQPFQPAPGNLEVLMCEHCGGGQHEASIVLCDNCPLDNTKGYHLFCCSPPLEKIPEGNWYCAECSDKLHGKQCFGNGPRLSYAQFARFADDFDQKYYGTSSTPDMVTIDDLEADFWKIIDEKEEVVEVLYGADIETGTTGSGFSSRGDFAHSLWNLNNLPRAPSSLLRLIPDNVPGVLVPWLYVGMRFSTFCWHVEDHLFYSVNYLHKGAGKKWYGVSSFEADQFESILRNDLLKDQFEKQPDLLCHLTTIVSPEKLMDRGLDLCETLQEEGEFVVTFPRAYHAGFNTGLNVAEAVNFAPYDWLRFAELADQRYALHRKSPVLSTDELLLSAAKSCRDGAGNLDVLWAELDRVIAKESAARLKIWGKGVKLSERMPQKTTPENNEMEDRQCAICRRFLHLSAVSCSCSDRIVCFQDIHHQCDCPLSSKKLMYRYSIGELTAMCKSTKTPTCTDEKMEVEVEERGGGGISNRGGELAGQDEKNLTDAYVSPVATSEREESIPEADLNAGTTALTRRVNSQGDQQGMKRSRDVTPNELDFSSLFDEFLVAWKQRAKKMVSIGGSRTAEIASLKLEAQQFLWAGQEVDELRKLYDKVVEAEEWIGLVKKAGQIKVSMEELDVVFGWHPPPVNIPGLSRLRGVRKAASEWKAQANDVLSSNSPVDVLVLESLVSAGLKLHVSLPDVAVLQARLHVGLEIRQGLECVFNQEHDDRRGFGSGDLRRLQQRAAQARVTLPELEKLRGTIKGIESWQEKARECLGLKSKLPRLQELLEQVTEIPAYVPEIDAMKALVRLVENWKLKATSAVQQRDSLKKMREHLHAGERLNVEVPEVEEFRRAVRQREWEANARRSLAGKQISISALEECISEGFTCGAQDMEIFVRLQQRKENALALKAKLRSMLDALEESKGGRSAIDMETLAGLVGQGTALHVRFDELQQATKLHVKCAQIHSQLKLISGRLVNGHPLDLNDVETLLQCVGEVGVEFDGTSELERKVALGKEFAGKARGVLDGGEGSSEGVVNLEQLKELLVEGNRFKKEHGFVTQEIEELWMLDSRTRATWLSQCILANPGSTMAVPSNDCLPLDVTAHSPLELLKPHFSQAIQQPPKEVDAPASVADIREKPSLRGGELLLQIACQVGVDEGLRGKLSSELGRGREWRDRFEEACYGGRILEVREASSWMEAADRIPFRLEGVENLKRMLDKYKEWERRVKELFGASQSLRKGAAEVKELTYMMKGCLIDGGNLKNQLKTIQDLVENFNISLCHAISLPLQEIFASVQRVLSAIHNQDGQGPLKACYCGCVTPDSPALTCVGCKEWIHLECLPVYAKASRKFLCPMCVPMCEINRPTHAELRVLLEAARQLRVRVPEEGQLNAIVKHYQQWHSHVTALLDGHDASRLVGGDPDGLLPEAVIHSMVKQTVMVGVDSTALHERVLDHRKSEFWRSRVQHLMLLGERTKTRIPKCRREDVPVRRNDMKPTIEHMQDLIVDSAGLRIDHTRDSMLVAAHGAISSCQQWAAEGRVIESLLGAHAGEPIHQVPADLLERTSNHIKQAQHIPIRVDPEILEYLVNQSTPYCLCKQTNEVDRPMLACEEEEKCPVLWYHYECVGLNTDLSPPPGYKCPHCCAAEGKAYPYSVPQRYAVDLAKKYGAQTVFGDAGRPCLEAFDHVKPGESVEENEERTDASRVGVLGSSQVSSSRSQVESDMGTYLAALAVQWGVLSSDDQLRALTRLEEKVKDEAHRLRKACGGRG
ncbi:hypothetical protein BSKO_12175 [Bryopsis sp. KO-2023]|nr:hypothetical protein BSKO_12175 [Bryopsis sp. KO-2023]